ncbi:hypothetical protein AB9Q10_12055 [Streptomyces krungchingensis]|uniref:hypothetical protein n=1 Tax=Streptomyces krungchingensis TaxID=1565034 RepID=UPI003CE69152
MTRMQKYLAATAVAVALVGAPTVSYAVSQGKAASGTSTHSAARTERATAVRPVAEAAARKAPTARIVAPGEHVAVDGGAEIWLTAEGKHWTTAGDPEPQFRSVVDGNVDLTRPGVSMQAEGDAEGRYFLSGLYYGGKGTASRVTVETKAGTVHGKLLELAGKPGWGVWYATARTPADGKGDPDFLGNVTVRDTKGRIYAQLK